ncbi:MAG TPA: hypothetical protein VGI37_09400 [Streptosporangiaceae bacterium]|jgi:hypothetical protein
MRSILVPAVAVAAATAAAVVPAVTSAASASASTSVNYVTQSNGHMDTTSVSGSATFQEPSGGGPVWAIDTLTEKWSVSAYAQHQTDGANYSVLMKVTAPSKFSQFANPNTGEAGVGTGKVLGVIQYDVSSTSTPATSIPATQAPNTGLGAVLDEIFGANSYTVVGGQNYDFTYNGTTVNSESGNAPYEQSSCTGTPHITAAQNPNHTAC